MVTSMIIQRLFTKMLIKKSASYVRSTVNSGKRQINILENKCKGVRIVQVLLLKKSVIHFL